MYPRGCTAPIHYVERDWCVEEYSGGCFAAVVGPTPEAMFASHGALLREPIVTGRVFVAGTEASTAFYGYLEGAARRGEEVAREILSTS